MAFCTVINCIDGRVQLPVIEYMRHRFDILWVDMITEPAPERLFSEGTDFAETSSVHKRVEVSVSCHDSRIITVVAHYDCAGTDATKEEQIEQLLASKVFLRKEWPECRIFALYVNEKWQVEEVIKGSA